MSHRATPRSKPTTVSLTAVAPPTWLPVVGLALIIVATCAAYRPAMNGRPLWDDDAHLTKPELRSDSGLVRIWTDPSATQQYYPLLHTAFWIEHQLWGSSVEGYHAITLAWHLSAMLLLYSILCRLNVPGALLAAAVFALHPVMVESVAWISEQKNTLSAVFYLSAMRVYLQFDESRKWPDYAVSFTLFAFGLLTKTVTATLPAALLVVFWWQRGRIEWRRGILPLVPFFLLGGLAGVITAWVEYHLIGAQGEQFAMSLLDRCLLAARVPWFYLSKLLWPVNLTFIYPRWHIDASVWWQWLFPVATLAMFVLLWLLRGWSRGPLAAWLLFVGTLAPVLGFLNVYPFLYSYVADHFQYLASIAPIVLVASGVSVGVAQLSLKYKQLSWATCGLLIVGYGFATHRQSGMYSNVEKLYQTTIGRNPSCWMAHHNLGRHYLIEGRQEDAVSCFEQALRIRPDYVEAHVNLGAAYIQSGDLQKSIGYLRQSVRLDPKRTDALNNLAYALVKTGQVEEGIAMYREALRLNPANAQVHNNLGEALAGMGQMPQAIDSYREALRLQPDYYEASCNLGVALAQTGDTLGGVEQLREAVRLQPTHSAAHINLADIHLREGNSAAAIDEYKAVLDSSPTNKRALESLVHVLVQLGRYEEAESAIQRALQSEPMNAALHVILGAVLNSAGRTAPAIAQFDAALKIDPNQFDAHNQLGFVYFRAGETEKALFHFREALRLRPDSADTEVNVGQVLRQAKRHEEAVPHFESALQIKPDHLQAYENLARALIAANRPRDAIATLKKGVAAARTAGQQGAAEALEESLQSYEAALKSDHDNGRESKSDSANP